MRQVLVRMINTLGEMRGTSAVVVTHNTRIVDRAGRIVIIEAGGSLQVEWSGQ